MLSVTINLLFAAVNLKPNPPPPHDQKVWHYDRANARLLRRSIDNLNWEGLFNQNSDPTIGKYISLPKPY